jgi:tetratricopeptide (TPR) repeat protein
MWAAIGVVTLMMAMLFLRQTDLSGFIENSRTGSIAEQGPDALPVIYIEASADTPEQVSMLATLRSGLSGFDTLDFIGRDFQGTPDPVANATSFAFKITSGHQQGSVTVELQNIGNGRVLHSRTFSPQELSPERIEDSVAALLSTTNTASGIIYAYIEQAGVQAGLTKCLLLNDDYYQDPREQTHRAAYSCFEKLIEQGGKSPLIYSEMAVLDLQTVTSGYSYPADASRERALSMGRKAVQMGATSSYAHRAYGYLNSRLGNTEESIHWMRKAYELNTYDLSMAAAYAYVLIFAGEYAAATPIMARAVDGSSARPAWWDFGLFLSYFMQGDMDKAANAAAGLNPASERSHYLVARLIAADHTGDIRTRDQLLTTLKDRFPYFSAKPRRVLEERKYPPDMVDKLLGALQAAGLGDAR